MPSEPTIKNFFSYGYEIIQVVLGPFETCTITARRRSDKEYFKRIAGCHYADQQSMKNKGVHLTNYILENE